MANQSGGWNRPTAGKPVAKKGGGKPNLGRGVLAGLLVIAASLGVLYFMRDVEKPAAKKAEKKPAKIEEVKPAAAPKPIQAQQPAAEEAEDDWTKSPDWFPGLHKGEKVVSMKTNDCGYIVRLLRDPNGKERYFISEPKSPWEYPTDRIIATALLTPEDRELPPWPPMGADEDDMFYESIKKPVKINPDDREDVRTIKMLVESAREEIKERMDKGELFMDIMEDHRKLANENGKIRSNAQREYDEIVRSGDLEGARKYALKVNVALQQMGIRELDLADEQDSEETK